MISSHSGTISTVAIVEANIPQRSCTGATVGPAGVSARLWRSRAGQTGGVLRMQRFGLRPPEERDVAGFVRTGIVAHDPPFRDGGTDADRFALPA